MIRSFRKHATSWSKRVRIRIEQTGCFRNPRSLRDLAPRKQNSPVNQARAGVAVGEVVCRVDSDSDKREFIEIWVIDLSCAEILARPEVCSRSNQHASIVK